MVHSIFICGRLKSSPAHYLPNICIVGILLQKVSQLPQNTHSCIKMLLEPLVDICRCHKWLFHIFGGKVVANFFYFLSLHMLVRINLQEAT